VSGTTDRFDALAAEFQRDTGMAAPGKDVPAEMGAEHTSQERVDAFVRWSRERRDGMERDAARYRFLRDHLLGLRAIDGNAGVTCIPEHFDARVDAAMACQAETTHA
jgi:hypothetical protein